MAAKEKAAPAAPKKRAPRKKGGTEKSTAPEKKPNISLADIAALCRATRVATKRGAFELAEAGALAQVVQRAETFVQAHGAPADEKPPAEEKKA